MSARVSLVVVAFRSSAVLGPAVESFRREARAAGVEAEVVVVDHSEDPAELARLQGLADTLLARSNRGYAAGINAGVAAAGGATLLVGNPDVRFAPGSLGALLDALGAGWDVVGPRFTLGELLLPPADEQTPAAEVARRAATWNTGLWRRHLAAEVRRWRRAWEAAAPLPQDFLSGALLAFARATPERVGPWDEGYFLYFEESEWLLRARRAGLRVGLAPAARVEHLWAHAADPVAHAATFARSRRRFYRRCHGVLGRLALAAPAATWSVALPPLPPGAVVGADDVLWLVSPNPNGLPSASIRSGASPPWAAFDAAARARDAWTPCTVTALDRRSERLLGAWTWRPGAG